MSELHRIVAATDLSPASVNAVDRGFEIAQQTGAHYTVVHALGLDALGPLRNLLGSDADLVAEKAIQNQYNALAALAGDGARNRGVVAELVVEAGLATSFVPAYAASEQADLVLVGARGQSTLTRLLVGSTASRLLRKSTCPVLVVKTPVSSHYSRVLVPVDFSPGNAASIRMARRVAPQADLVLLHSFDVPFEGMLQYAGVAQDTILGYRREARERTLRMLHELADTAGLDRGSYTAVVEHGDASRHIFDTQARYACDLVAMGKHGTHVTEELLLGSVTKHVLSEVDADILVTIDRHGPTTLPSLPGEDFV